MKNSSKELLPKALGNSSAWWFGENLSRNSELQDKDQKSYDKQMAFYSLVLVSILSLSTVLHSTKNTYSLIRDPGTKFHAFSGSSSLHILVGFSAWAPHTLCPQRFPFPFHGSAHLTQWRFPWSFDCPPATCKGNWGHSFCTFIFYIL